MNHLQNVDVLVILLYFAAVILVAWWAFRRNDNESESYFLAGRDLGWFAVGASLFASNIGSEHLVGLSGTGAASGLAVGHFEWLAALILLLLGWLFVPFYLRSGVFTMPEFLGRRYNPACRWYFTAISVIGYVLTKISVSLYAGGIIIKEVAGLDMWISAGVIVVFTGIYTVLGGLRAVVYTDMLQTVVLLLGSALLVFTGLGAVGGWSELVHRAPDGFFSMWKAASHPQFPWTGIVFGAPILGIWYWCTDQCIVQRTLSAKNLGHARGGTILAGYLKILPVFLFVLPGIIARVLFADMNASNSDQALPRIVLHLLSPGMRGLFLAALLAALMGSLSAVFNSCSTLITWDVFRKLKPDASEATLVSVGRWTTVLLAVLGLLWIPFMKYISSQLYVYLQSVQGYIAPPIAACFLLGLFISRLNGTGAISALGIGFILGFARLGLELLNGPNKTGLPAGTFWEWIAEINFLHFAVILFVICSMILVGVSFLTPAPTAESLAGLTWEHRSKGVSTQGDLTMAQESRLSHRLNQVLSLLLVGVMFALWFWLG
ncbi:MAG: sodium transporter [Proteobacteria bacterium]|nr:sodium transporter [Pseudomonadota bacterium]NDC24192.1 sodium transporter [Pseudomonadota bacterium]NDD03601.1 sodium transporter [Pseudomonadota bacterium]NDG25760.1 sodium transporter [Pseudomonadota bacterium]